MDSPFNRQYSLYESISNRDLGSATSLNNLASKSTSRLGSPAAASSALKPDALRDAGTPLADQRRLSKVPTGASWGAAPAQPKKDAPATGAGSSTDRLSGFNAFSASLSSPFSGLGYQYANSGSSGLMGFAGAQPSSAFGAVGGGGGSSSSSSQLGSSQLGSNQLGSNQLGSNQFSSIQNPSPYAQSGSQFGGNTQFGSSQFGAPYGGSQFGFAPGQPGVNGAFGGGQALDAVQPDTGGIKGRHDSQLSWGAGLQPDSKAKSPMPTKLGVAGVAAAALIPTPEAEAPDELVLPPSNMFWNYIDLQGQMQGPFSGTQMNEWLAYLMDITLIRRVTDSFFISLGSLKEVTGSEEPFVVLLSGSAWVSVIRRAAEVMNRQDPGGNAGDAAGLPQAVEEPDAAAAAASAADQAWTDSLPSRQSSLAPGDNVAQAISRLAVGSPGDVDSKPEPRTPLEAASVRAGEDAAPSLAAAGLSSLPKPASPKAEAEAVAVASPRAEPAPAPATDPWKKPSKPSPQISIAELKQQQELSKQQKKKAESAASNGSSRKAQPRWLPLEQLQQQQLLQAQPDLLQSQQFSHQQIQPLPQHPSQQHQHQQQQQFQPLFGQSPARQASPIAGPTPTWSKKAVQPARSLADIQKEQALKNRKSGSNSSLASAPGVSASKIPSKPALLKTESPFKPKPLVADDFTARAAAGPAVRSAKIPNQRTQPSIASVTATASKARPTDELVHWARVSFKDLMKGIDAMELLGVFLSLPANGSAKEFIAESIYSYSKTLDGRRFASDFLSRKKSAEASMAPGETWADVLNRFNPNVVEQDPSFKVVTKKRTQKIARPGDGMHT